MTSRAPAASLLFAAALALCLAGLGPAGAPPAAPAPAPNVLVLTVDTLRPDALGWVAGRNSTPALDALAGEGFRFQAAVAPAPLTLPSHASLFTGLLPRRHGGHDNGQVIGPGAVTLAEVLQGRGYTTAAFVSGYPLAALFGLDQGFGVYDDHLAAGGDGQLERRADRTVAAAAAWLSRAREPWLLWVHLYDPHYPYEPPAAFTRPGARGAYDGEVAFADRAIGELRRAVAGRRPGPSARAVFTVFAGDHGESLGEHGEGTHGFYVYDSTVTVPLVFHWPGRIAPGEGAASPRLIDVAPTVLDLLGGLGAPSLPAIDGTSLRPALQGRLQELPAYVETYQPWTSYGWAPLKALRARGWKLVVAPRPELYDLRADPGERRNVYDVERRRAREILATLRAVESAPPAATARRAEDPEAMARLRALGYAGAATPGPGEPPPGGLLDPKDGAELRALLTAGDLALRAGEPRRAAERFDAVLARDPKNRFALARSGEAFLALREPRRAIERLERAVGLDPEQPDYRIALARAHAAAGDHRAAARQWMEVARLQPRRVEAWSNLGAELGLAGDPAKAVAALVEARRLEPGDPEHLVRLAFAEAAAGRPAAAAEHLRAAARELGDRFAHAAALGILLVRAGRPAEALPWLRAARPSEAEYADARRELAKLEAAAGRPVPPP